MGAKLKWEWQLEMIVVLYNYSCNALSFTTLWYGYVSLLKDVSNLIAIHGIVSLF